MNDDTISRKMAIDALIRAREPINNGDGTSTIMPLTDAAIRKVLTELPSVQPQRMRGRWLEVRDYEGEQIKITHTECSACHQGGNDKWNYCPNCGADMRGGHNGIT